MQDNKYIIWGAGHRGEIIYKIFGKGKIEAFIDSNLEKQRTGFCGKRVIDYETYKIEYSNLIVIVSPFLATDIIKKLENDSILFFRQDECPTEFMGYGYSNIEKSMSFLINNISDNSYIYGISLYSLYLFSRLERVNKNNIIFIPQKGYTEEKIKKTRDKYSISIAKNSDFESILNANKNNIYAAIYDEIVNPELIEKNNNKVFDIFDFSREIIKYTNDKIKIFKNKYVNKRCFIVATGPSLRIEDLEKLYERNELCISMNSIFYSFSKTKWRPNFYVILDGDRIDKWRNEIIRIDVNNVFIADSSIYMPYSLLPNNYYIYHAISGKYFTENIKITNDFSEKVYNSSFVINICFQLAIYMGFSEIYLLGTDFKYNIGTANNHFMSNNKTEKEFSKSLIQDSLLTALTAFKKMKKETDAINVKIYNATRGGNLEIFPRIDFDSLFN